jgi:hydrogenase maturation protein HypF
MQAPVLGLALDGVGLGDDGGAWGGELLVVDAHGFRRIGQLAPLRLPGGDVAAREPWRMAASALFHTGRTTEIARRFADEPAAATVTAMLERGWRSPPTSSMGRYFDAAAGLLGVRRRMGFEGQAAMLLEGLAEAYGPAAPHAGGFTIGDTFRLDLTPLLGSLADERDPGRGAAVFHSTLVAALAQWVVRAVRAERIGIVACGGGCFLNAKLGQGLRDALAPHGIAMLEAQQVPPNDGGLSLGQALVALQGAEA